jgi:hypothetical protein
MNKPPANKPPKPPSKPDRAAREAAALRANLLKRKDQARRREEANEGQAGADPQSACTTKDRREQP